MVTAVRMHESGFKAYLSFDVFDWLITEAMLDRQTKPADLKLDEK